MINDKESSYVAASKVRLFVLHPLAIVFFGCILAGMLNVPKEGRSYVAVALLAFVVLLGIVTWIIAIKKYSASKKIEKCSKQALTSH